MSESVYTKLPVFDGSKEDWPFYKPKLKALLAKKKLSKILTWKGKLREDDFVWAQDYDKKKKKEEEEMQEMNVDAASILLQSIDTEKAEGKAVFYQVEQYMDDGFAGGHFPKAWKALCDRYDETDVVDPIDLQQDYFDLKMDDVEQPSTFIVKLERQRKKLKDNGIKYGDDEFLKQILAKLPKGKDGELGPYQVEKRNIELQMQTKQGYGIGDLTTALEKVYKDIYGEDGSGKANEQAYSVYKKV